MALFPHQKLDWSIKRLEQRLEANPDDAAPRLDLALHQLSRAWFHDGGEVWFNKALTQARRVLQSDPANPHARILAGSALVGLDRLDPARTYLHEALEMVPDSAAAHLAMASFHQTNGRLGDASGRHQAVKELEAACRLAADAWEPHWQLGKLLWEMGQELAEGSNQRLMERSQYHTVRALELGPSPAVEPRIVYHLGIACLHAGRFPEADKLFTRLLDDADMRATAQYYLGLVHYHLGRYKNAVLYLRQHMQSAPESAKVFARIGMCYLQLGEVVKAREACNRALAIDPNDLQARWCLGCAMVEEDRDDEALRTFKGILEDAPDHLPAFQELVRLRSRRDDLEWLRAALRAEVQVFDRLPVSAERTEHGKPKPVFPRKSTRARLGILLQALAQHDEDSVTAMLESMDITTDESLRFALWEAALDRTATRRARGLAETLQSPGASYSADAGREVLALARSLPEQLLTAGLQIDEEHLRRQAVERHGPANDVAGHRRAIDDERREARAWQALLLLSIASHDNRSSRNLLVRWAAEADADLADAARAALAMLGDDEATAVLRKRAKARGAENLVDAMLTQVQSRVSTFPVRPAEEGDDVVCSTCGRRAHEADLLLVGANGALCSHCLVDVARSRKEHLETDPEAVCALSRRSAFEARAMYRFRGVVVCREVLDDGLGRLEREAVDRYLAAL